MPLQLLLIITGAGALAIYGRPMPALVGTAAVVLVAATLVVLARLAPPPSGVGFRAQGELLDETRYDRASNLTAYASVLLVAGVGMFLCLWWLAPALALLAAAAIWAAVWWPDSLRRSNLTTSIVIKREPAAVFAFVSDGRNLLSYWPHYESVELLTPGPIGLRTQFRSRVRFPKGFADNQEHIFEGIEEIVGFEPPTRLATHVKDRPRPHLAVFRFDAVPEGTLLTHSFTFVSSYSSAFLGGEFSGHKATRLMRASRTSGWSRAKEILESGTS